MQKEDLLIDTMFNACLVSLDTIFKGLSGEDFGYIFSLAG